MSAGGRDSIGVAVTGAGGRMGREVLDMASGREDLTVDLAVNRSVIGEVSGFPVVPLAAPTDLTDELDRTDPDVLVDFTAPESSVEYIDACASAGVPAVVGTTGFDADNAAVFERASDSIPVLRATNFSRGIVALRRAIRPVLEALPGYDVELTETHHNGKRDAPSGTALTLLDDIENVVSSRDEGAQSDTAGSSERVYGRNGIQPRDPGEIGVHARRAGDIWGEHELLLAGNRETIELTHRAGDRGVFAAGALDAAEWLVGREPGSYEFDAVIDADLSDSDGSGAN